MSTHGRLQRPIARYAAPLGAAAAHALRRLRPLLAATATAIALAALLPAQLHAQTIKRGDIRTVKGGILQQRDTTRRAGADSTAIIEVGKLFTLLPDSLLQDTRIDSLLRSLQADAAATIPADSLVRLLPDSLRSGIIYDGIMAAAVTAGAASGASAPPDDGERSDRERERNEKRMQKQSEKQRMKAARMEMRANDSLRTEKIRQPLFADSASLSKVCLMAAVMPGYGQIYNKQYWKLPVLYSTIGASIGVAIHQGSLYKPLKRQYDALAAESMSRTEEMNSLQRRMIRANTARQLMWATAAASYIYFLGDAAVNYSTNEVSDVKKATTLSLICPGAGQVYNKSYWKVPIVIGGLASMAYVIDWNNRGFQRFKTAYALRSDFEKNPGKYPDGVSHDEFGGRYSASYLKNLRDSYRRNRDLSIILTIAVYAFQAIDAHVDAHLKDFDVSDDLTVSLEPMFDTTYTQVSGTQPTFGFNLNVRF